MSNSRFALMAAAAVALGTVVVATPPRWTPPPIERKPAPADLGDDTRQRKRHLQRQARKQQRAHRK